MMWTTVHTYIAVDIYSPNIEYCQRCKMQAGSHWAILQLQETGEGFSERFGSSALVNCLHVSCNFDNCLHVSCSFDNCLQLLAWIYKHSYEPLSNHCRIGQRWTKHTHFLRYSVLCVLCLTHFCLKGTWNRLLHRIHSSRGNYFCSGSTWMYCKAFS